MMIAIAMALAPSAAQAQPRPVPAHAIDVQVEGGGLIVTVDRGADDGVTVRWRARCRVGKLTVEGTILRAPRHAAIVKLSHVTLDGLPAAITCELIPPD